MIQNKFFFVNDNDNNNNVPNKPPVSKKLKVKLKLNKYKTRRSRKQFIKYFLSQLIKTKSASFGYFFFHLLKNKKIKI